mgnify:CR=1 FL=1
MQLEQIKCVLDLLLAAAAADGHTDAEERAQVRRLVQQLGRFSDQDLTELENHQWSFEPGAFELERAIRGLGQLSVEEKRAVIALLEEVESADGIIDMQEEEFILRVGRALGLAEDEIQELAIRIEEEPPPLPKA